MNIEKGKTMLNSSEKVTKRSGMSAKGQRDMRQDSSQRVRAMRRGISQRMKEYKRDSSQRDSLIRQGGHRRQRRVGQLFYTPCLRASCNFFLIFSLKGFSQVISLAEPSFQRRECSVSYPSWSALSVTLTWTYKLFFGDFENENKSTKY